MTLLGAIDVGDRVMLAADVALVHTESRELFIVHDHVDRVWRHICMPGLMWGFTGDGAVGRNFNAWIQARTFDSWSELLTGSQHLVRRLNDAAKRFADNAGAPRAPVNLLIAGHLGSESVVAIVHENGDLSCAGPRDPIFLGSDARSAVAAWHALKLALQESFVPEQGFRYAMDSAIAATPALGGPARVYEALA